MKFLIPLIFSTIDYFLVRYVVVTETGDSKLAFGLAYATAIVTLTIYTEVRDLRKEVLNSSFEIATS